jgi:cold shock CspA family protein
VSDELDKNAISAGDEDGDDVEAHKNAISKSAISADDDDNDVEAHKSAISKSAISADDDEKTSIS